MHLGLRNCSSTRPAVSECAVPENIQTYPLDGHWKFQGGGGGGSQRVKFSKESMKVNWNFWRVGRFRPKPICGVGMDFFWNDTIKKENNYKC